jgi:hypothetical protein
VFDEELVIGSVKAQVNRLSEMSSRLELDGRWKDHSLYYASEMRDIEKRLRMIRKVDFENIYRRNAENNRQLNLTKKKGRI